MNTNAVDKITLRKIQKETLNTLKEILLKSFGPYGSNTIISNDTTLPRYTKDGHTILKNIKFSGNIEKTVLDDIEAETRTQAVNVGDSTTSVTILSALIFEAMTKYLETEEASKIPPAVIVSNFEEVVKRIKCEIKNNAKKISILDIFNIAYTSTNGNETLSNIIESVYKKYGLEVYIDVKASFNGNTYIKELNGMTIESGVIDSTFINNPVTKECELRNPKIYAFQDPIDTIEMGAYFDYILHQNIINPMFAEKNMDEVIPTVIIAPRISRDFSAFMDQITQYNAQAKSRQKLPLNIITNFTDMESFVDICDLCGCKYIKKYIEPRIFQRDVENKLAATPENVDIMAGSAEVVRSDVNKSIFVNPANMYDENGHVSSLYEQRLDFIEGNINKLTNEGNNLTELYKLKKRYNSLTGNMVEIYIGGLTVADRDQLRDLTEDAVLNCRSACKSGTGYGANYEGLIASRKVYNEFVNNNETRYIPIASIIYNCFEEISKLLYNTYYNDEDKASHTVCESIKEGCPMDIRTGKFNRQVLSSIETDVCAIDSISKIISIMVTSNQILLPTINDYKY